MDRTPIHTHADTRMVHTQTLCSSNSSSSSSDPFLCPILPFSATIYME
uniref:Uncharacterized protein n=1 Tax=Arundo donax TaxID=35708 RepID=A0A0A9GG93_ARUDO